MSKVAPSPSVDAPALRDRGEAEAPRPRVRACIEESLRDVGYSGAVLVWSIVGFTILVSGVTVTLSLLALLALVVGVLAWIGLAYVARWTTWVDRGLAGWRRRERVPAIYRRPATRGFLPFVKALSTDPQTWRDLVWLALTSLVGFAGAVVVVTAAGLALAYVSMPLWYWAVTDPSTQYGLTNLGKFTVDTAGEAFTTTAIGIALLRWCCWRLGGSRPGMRGSPYACWDRCQISGPQPPGASMRELDPFLSTPRSSVRPTVPWEWWDRRLQALDQLVQLSVGGGEVHVPLSLGAGRVVRGDTCGDQFCDSLIQVGNEKTQRPGSVAHAAGGRHRERTTVRKLEQVRFDALNLVSRSAEDLGDELGHGAALWSSCSGEAETEDVHTADPRASGDAIACRLANGHLWAGWRRSWSGGLSKGHRKRPATRPRRSDRVGGVRWGTSSTSSRLSMGTRELQ